MSHNHHYLYEDDVVPDYEMLIEDDKILIKEAEVSNHLKIRENRVNYYRGEYHEKLGYNLREQSMDYFIHLFLDTFELNHSPRKSEALNIIKRDHPELLL